MVDTYEARVVDAGVTQAWRAWRLRVAEHLESALVEDRTEQLTFTTPTGESLTVDTDEGRILLIAGDELDVTTNVDEAAYAVFQRLHDDWSVVHPAFVDGDLDPRVPIPDNPIGSARLPVPVLGRAVSRDQLQSWVESTFQETLAVPLKVLSNGDIAWRGRRGEMIFVSVRNDSRIEVWTVLARYVGRKKARKQIDRLSRRLFGLKFYLRQDELVMARSFLASPFVPDHLHQASRVFTASSRQLGWVEDRVLRDRVRRERADLAAAEERAEELRGRFEASEQERREAQAALRAVRASLRHVVDQSEERN